MRQVGPRSLLDDLFSLCFSLLVAAAAVYIAVKLIVAVWPVLMVILAAGALLMAGLALLRRRDRGW